MKYYIPLTDLSKIKHLASVRENENFRFRTFLKCGDSDRIDSIVHKLHDEITESINCSTCGNCCKHLNPSIKKEEIEILASLENINPEEYIKRHCEEEYGDIFLKETPCRYLENTECKIYDHRPEDCCLFPYTRKKRFISRLYGMLDRYEICPIVFNLMERLKDELRFKRDSQNILNKRKK